MEYYVCMLTHCTCIYPLTEERRILGQKMAEFRADTEARANDQEAQRRDIHAYRTYLAGE